MGFFSLKSICSNCEKEVGLNRYKIAEGWICPACFKACGYNSLTPIRLKKVQDIKNDITEINKQNNLIIEFNTTKKVGGFIEIDEHKKQFLIKNGGLGIKKNQRVYNFNDVIEYELLEDGESITKGGLGRALVGGVLFGGVGAIVGGVTGGKKTKNIINSLKIKITLNNISSPTVYINIIQSPTKSNSIIYKTCYDSAQQILSIFDIIQNENNKQKDINNSSNSPADEIVKFKALLDQGIITADEFDSKKKQLLNL